MLHTHLCLCVLDKLLCHLLLPGLGIDLALDGLDLVANLLCL